MGTFILTIGHILFIIVMFAPGSLCEECGSFVPDDQLYADYNDSVMIPLESYCFVNECTIRIEESNVLLNVINNTGDWIIATNTTNCLFMIFVNDSINSCSSDSDHGTNLYQLDTELYVIRMIVSSSGIIAGVANIVMHLMVKKLRTVSGILVIFQCASIVVVLMIGGLRTPFYYYQIHTPAEVCAILFDYLNVVCTNIYVATRATILAHFCYVMYRTYRLLGKIENERSLLYKYITFIAGACTINSIIIIAVDVTVNNPFEAGDGQCVYFFDTLDREGTQLTQSNVVYFVIIIIWLLVQTVLVTIGLVLYFLNTKRCCATSTSRDFRVFIVLMTIIDLNTIIFIVLLVINVPTLIGNTIIMTVAASEQVALFALFASSSKVTCCSVCNSV